MPEQPELIKQLSDLDIDEVSLVRRGANQHADVLISKADEEDEVEKNRLNPEEYLEEEEDEEATKASPQPQDMHVEKPLEDEEEDEEEARKGFFSNLVEKLFGDSTTTPGSSATITDVDDNQEVQKHDGHQFPAQGTFGQGTPQPGLGMQMPQTPQGFPGQQGMPTGMVPGAAPGMAMPGQQGMPQASGAPLPAEVIEYIKQLESALAQKTGGEQSSSQQEEDMSNPFGKSGEEQEGQELEFLQELAKSLEDEDTREAVAKAMDLVEKANTRAEEAERIAKEEQEHRLNREYVELAKSYAGLPVSPEEFGPVLKRLHDHLGEEDIEVLSKVFSAKSEEMESLFGEFGKVGGADNSDVFTQVEKQAEEIAKSEGITAEQARARVLESNPKLYDEYLAESR